MSAGPAHLCQWCTLAPSSSSRLLWLGTQDKTVRPEWSSWFSPSSVSLRQRLCTWTSQVGQVPCFCPLPVAGNLSLLLSAGFQVRLASCSLLFPWQLNCLLSLGPRMSYPLPSSLWLSPSVYVGQGNAPTLSPAVACLCWAPGSWGCCLPFPRSRGRLPVPMKGQELAPIWSRGPHQGSPLPPPPLPEQHTRTAGGGPLSSLLPQPHLRTRRRSVEKARKWVRIPLYPRLSRTQRYQLAHI